MNKCLKTFGFWYEIIVLIYHDKEQYKFFGTALFFK